MRSIIASLALLALAGCASTPVISNVTRFHALPEAASSKTFSFVPNTEQHGSLEYQTYCERIASKLEAHGWRRARADEKPSLGLVIDYGIGKGETVSGTNGTKLSQIFVVFKAVKVDLRIQRPDTLGHGQHGVSSGLFARVERAAVGRGEACLITWCGEA